MPYHEATNLAEQEEISANIHTCICIQIFVMLLLSYFQITLSFYQSQRMSVCSWSDTTYTKTDTHSILQTEYEVLCHCFLGPKCSC